MHVTEIIRSYSESDKKILYLNDELKIRFFDNANKGYNKLEEHIYIWCKFLGVKDMDEDNAQMLVAYLKESYKDFSIQEISHALMIGLQGRLNIDMEHYQNFSPIYLSKILNAYKIYRNKLIIKYRKEKEEYFDKKNKKIPSKKETLNNIFLITQNLYADFILQEETFIENKFHKIKVAVIYDLLLKNKIIKGIDLNKYEKIKLENRSDAKLEYIYNFFLRLKEKKITIKNYFLKKLK